jgi:phospholipase/lecithinase/hemolysin
MILHRAFFIAVAIGSIGYLSVVLTSAHAPTVTHLGIMGDSASDEYRADDDRGGAYASTTLSWDELLERYRGVNIGRWGTWGGPRRSGYEYNWAHSGATAEDVVNTGQATGLAQQVAAGEVNTVVLYVGANDFAIWNGAYATIYNGTLADKTLEDYVHSVVSSIATAIDTVRAAGPVNMIVTNLEDGGANPLQFPDPIKRQLVSNSVVSVNAGIRSVVNARPGVALVDLHNAASDPVISSRIDLTNGNLMVADQGISLKSDGDEPHHALLSDGHFGTVIGCLLANYIFINPLNSQFGQNITLFSDEECLANAGISVDVR